MPIDPEKQVEVWSEFGLPGLVIMALFAALFWIVYYSSKTANGNLERFIDETKTTRQEHAAERKNWAEGESKRTEAVKTALDRLSDAVRKNP